MSGNGLTKVVKYGLLGIAIAVCCGQGRLLFTLTLQAASGPKDLRVGALSGVVETQLRARMAGKSALIVGGTRGVGRGIARAVVRTGGTCTIVGRTAEKASVSLRDAFPGASVKAYPADLSTVSGCAALGKALRADDSRFDLVFFTVGTWPDFKQPFTPDGVERVVALDLLARHVVLKRLADDGMLAHDAVVVNTLASTVYLPFVSRLGVELRLKNNRRPMDLVTGIINGLFPVAVAADAYLRSAAETWPNLTYVGMFPGLVATDIFAASLPEWAVRIFHILSWPFSISEDESGTAHLAIAASPNCRMRNVSYWNHLLESRATHPLAYNDALANYVFDFVDGTANRLLSEANNTSVV